MTPHSTFDYEYLASSVLHLRTETMHPFEDREVSGTHETSVVSPAATPEQEREAEPELEPPRVSENESGTTPDIHNVAIKLQRAKEAYKEFAGIEEQPNTGEIILWYLYGLCSYFVHTVLIPILFPLIVSTTVSKVSPPPQGWTQSFRGFPCSQSEMKLYQSLTLPSIGVSSYRISPLEWTALSWAIGILVSTPILGYISPHLDHGRSQNIIFGGATALGALFCLPAGFFNVPWIFPPYIAIVVASSIVGFASHTRHFGLMVRGFSTSSPLTNTKLFARRASIGSWLSLVATAAGCLGAAIISSFTYRMLGHDEKLVSLWVVSIFSGLIWIVGTVHAFSVNRPGSGAVGRNSSWGNHVFSIFKYPHAVGTLTSVLLSSFTSNCIFTAGVLYIMGQVCLEPKFVLFIWLIYFLIPVFALPILHPVQQFAKIDALRMKVLGFLVSATISGLAFYYRHTSWQRHHLLFLAAIQSLATGILHAFGRVLLLDCTPAKKEGAFSVWFAWVKAVGACIGFTVAAVFPDKFSQSFGITFCTSMAGVLVLIFGNVSNRSGAIAAGHVVWEDSSEKGEGNGSVLAET